MALCKDTMAGLPCEIAAAKKGNKNVLNKMVGAVMKVSRGRADAKRVREIIEGLVYDSSAES